MSGPESISASKPGAAETTRAAAAGEELEPKPDSAAVATPAAAAPAKAARPPVAKPKPKPRPQAAAPAPTSPRVGGDAPAAPGLAATTPASPSAGAQAAREVRKARARRLLWGLAIWVGLPTLLALVYYGGLVQPQYESVTSFVVRGAEPQKRAALLQEYVLSRDMLAELERHKKFSAHYQKSSDPLARLSPSAGSESRYAYYRDHVLTDFEAATGLITVRVRAFSGAFAAELADQILTQAKEMLVTMNQRQSAKMLASAERDLLQAQSKLLAHRQRQDEKPVDGRAFEQSSPEVDLARHEVQAALDGLMAVRATVRSQEEPVAVITTPSRPDEATHPRRARGVLSVFLVALSLFGIGSLLVSSVREHAHF